MIDCVECFDEVYEDHMGFKVVFSAELDGGFQREDGVGASFSLKAAALFLHAIISDVGVHAVCNDCGEDFVCHVEKANGVPVVGVGCLSFELEDGAEGVHPLK